MDIKEVDQIIGQGGEAPGSTQAESGQGGKLSGIWEVKLSKKESQGIFGEFRTIVKAKITDLESIAQETKGEAHLESERYGDIEVDFTRARVKSDTINIYYAGRYHSLGEMIEQKVEEAIREKAIKKRSKEIELSIRDIVREVYKEFNEIREKKKRVDYQQKEFEKRQSYALYTHSKYRNLNYKEQKEYEELEKKLETTVLSDDELSKVLQRLDELYNIAINKEREKELEKLREYQKRYYDLKDRYDRLVQLIKDKMSSVDIIEYFKEQEEEGIDEKIRDEWEELFSDDC